MQRQPVRDSNYIQPGCFRCPDAWLGIFKGVTACRRRIEIGKDGEVNVGFGLGLSHRVNRPDHAERLFQAEAFKARENPIGRRVAGDPKPVTQVDRLFDQLPDSGKGLKGSVQFADAPASSGVELWPIERPAREYFKVHARVEAVNVTNCAQPIFYVKMRSFTLINFLPSQVLGHLRVDNQAVKIQNHGSGPRGFHGWGLSLFPGGAARYVLGSMIGAAAWLLAQPLLAEDRLVVPSEGAYTGAYIDFGDTEDNVTLEAIRKFETLVGKHQAIVASSSYWGRGFFPTNNARLITGNGAVPLIYWSPWGPPYEQGKHVDPGPWRLRRIAAGDCDAYIDKWAAAARDFGQPLLVSFGCEANSNWFPWSGYDNGADTKNPDGSYAGPDLYKSAYRHAVDRVRAAGARNIQWVFHVNNDSHPDRKWNAISEYYPGGGLRGLARDERLRRTDPRQRRLG